MKRRLGSCRQVGPRRCGQPCPRAPCQTFLSACLQPDRELPCPRLVWPPIWCPLARARATFRQLATHSSRHPKVCGWSRRGGCARSGPPGRQRTDTLPHAGAGDRRTQPQRQRPCHSSHGAVETTPKQDDGDGCSQRSRGAGACSWARQRPARPAACSRPQPCCPPAGRHHGTSMRVLGGHAVSVQALSPPGATRQIAGASQRAALQQRARQCAHLARSSRRRLHTSLTTCWL